MLIIRVEVPKAVCSRCSKTAPLRPQAMRVSSSKQFPGFIATDALGNVWEILQADRPEKWVQGPDGGNDAMKGLCEQCNIDLHQTVKSFLTGSESIVLRPSGKVAFNPVEPSRLTDEEQIRLAEAEQVIAERELEEARAEEQQKLQRSPIKATASNITSLPVAAAPAIPIANTTLPSKAAAGSFSAPIPALPQSAVTAPVAVQHATVAAVHTTGIPTAVQKVGTMQQAIAAATANIAQIPQLAPSAKATTTGVAAPQAAKNIEPAPATLQHQSSNVVNTVNTSTALQLQAAKRIEPAPSMRQQQASMVKAVHSSTILPPTKAEPVHQIQQSTNQVAASMTTGNQGAPVKSESLPTKRI